MAAALLGAALMRWSHRHGGRPAVLLGAAMFLIALGWLIGLTGIWPF